MISRREKERRMAVAREEAGLELVYSVDLFGDFVEVKGEIGGDLYRRRTYFNNDGTVKYTVEK